MDREQPLDFNRPSGEQPATLIECVSVVVRGFGKDGCTSYDVMGTLQKNLPQFKPASAGPALSKLVLVGAVSAQHEYGVRRYYHVRDYDRDLDALTIRQHENEQALKRAEAGLQTGQRMRAAPTPNAAAPAPASQVARGAVLAISLGERRTEIVDIQTAREIYESLKVLFEPRR